MTATTPYLTKTARTEAEVREIIARKLEAQQAYKQHVLNTPGAADPIAHEMERNRLWKDLIATQTQAREAMDEFEAGR